MIKFYKSRLLSNYSLIEKLEKEFSEYTGFKYGVAVDSCTSALFLCLEWERMKYGNKAITIPDRTYVSVANEIIHTGHTLILDKNYYAVGNAYLLVGTHIVDSAHAVEKNVIHDWEDKYCYSFYPTKLVPSYEGGMICTDDEAFVNWAIFARQMGRTKYGANYDVVCTGWKMNMTPIQAKEALKSLKLLPKWLEKSSKIRNLYNKYLNPVVDTPHIYSIIYDKEPITFQGSRHFYPISSKSAYGNDKRGSVPLSLPLHPKLTKHEQMKIIKEVLE